MVTYQLCVGVMNSNMLLKVKPDGPVYEVQFTSQLICMPHNTVSVGSTQLQTVPTSEIISDATVTSDSSSTYPVISSVPAVNASHGETLMRKALSESSRMHQSNTASSQQMQTCSPMYYDRQPPSDNVLNCNAATVAARHTTAETLENFAATASTAHSDVVSR